MIVVEPCSRGHAFRLKPDDELESLRVRVIGNSAQAPRKPLGIHFPGPGVCPYASGRIPSCVDPPVIELHALFCVPVDEKLLIFLVVIDIWAVVGTTPSSQLAEPKPVTHLRHVVSNHPVTPEILAP